MKRMRKNKEKGKSYKERLDPGLQVQNSLKSVNLIVSLPNHEEFGITPEQKEKMESTSVQYNDLMNMEQVAQVLSAKGWCVYSRSDFSVYQEAAAQVLHGNDRIADQILTNHWNTEGKLGVSLLRLRPLYMFEEPFRLDIAEARHDILKLALELHEEKKYSASIPLLISQIDGICADVTNEPAKYLFQKKFFQQNVNHLLDDETLEGHKFCLAALSKLFSKQVTQTDLDDSLLRHGIMHGRTLRYGTKTNSTKLFVALEAFLMWARNHVWRDDHLTVRRKIPLHTEIEKEELL